MPPNDDIADQLMAAYAAADMLPPPSASDATFDIDAGYAVLEATTKRRERDGWRMIGRKVGFTNRTIWELYGVDAPFWAPLWGQTVIHAVDGAATVSLERLVQPRIEPEVVFTVNGPVARTDDPAEILRAVTSMAPAFEIVQCPYPGWNFALQDCIAAFGLHGRLVVGEAVAVDDSNRDIVASTLPTFTLTLARNDENVATGVGANVLDSPALALAHVARVVESQPDAPPFEPGEFVTTGTITDAFPIVRGETWSSDYGELGLKGLRITFE